MFDGLRQLLGLITHQPAKQAVQQAPDITYNPNPNTNIPYSTHNAGQARQLAQPLQVRSSTGLQQPASPDGVYPQVQGSYPNLQMQGFNPQGMQGNFGLQGQFGGPDTSYSGGNDAQAGFPIFLQDLLRRR